MRLDAAAHGSKVLVHHAVDLARALACMISGQRISNAEMIPVNAGQDCRPGWTLHFPEVLTIINIIGVGPDMHPHLVLVSLVCGKTPPASHGATGWAPRPHLPVLDVLVQPRGELGEAADVGDHDHREVLLRGGARDGGGHEALPDLGEGAGVRGGAFWGGRGWGGP